MENCTRGPVLSTTGHYVVPGRWRSVLFPCLTVFEICLPSLVCRAGNTKPITQSIQIVVVSSHVGFHFETVFRNAYRLRRCITERITGRVYSSTLYDMVVTTYSPDLPPFSGVAGKSNGWTDVPNCKEFEAIVEALG